MGTEGRGGGGVKHSADEGGCRGGSATCATEAKPLEALLLSEELSIVCGDEVDLSLCLILTL